jgi:hypothetical protein
MNQVTPRQADLVANVLSTLYGIVDGVLGLDATDIKRQQEHVSHFDEIQHRVFGNRKDGGATHADVRYLITAHLRHLVEQLEV